MKIFVGIENVIAEKLVSIPMELRGPSLQHRIDVAAAVSALRSVVQRSLHLELLDDVRVGQWHIVVLRDVVVGRADAFDQVIVIVFALAIHENARRPAAQLRRLV